MATNRIESLDPALIRPGRIDRKIEFPLPDAITKRRIFGIHTGRMTLSDDVNIEEFVMAKVSFRCWVYACCLPTLKLVFKEDSQRLQTRHGGDLCSHVLPYVGSHWCRVWQALLSLRSTGMSFLCSNQLLLDCGITLKYTCGDNH